PAAAADADGFNAKGQGNVRVGGSNPRLAVNAEVPINGSQRQENSGVIVQCCCRALADGFNLEAKRACALCGMALMAVPPSMWPTFQVVRGEPGSFIFPNAASAFDKTKMGLGIRASIQEWPPGPVMTTLKRLLPSAWMTMLSVPAPSRTMTDRIRAAAGDSVNRYRIPRRLPSPSSPTLPANKMSV